MQKITVRKTPCSEKEFGKMCKSNCISNHFLQDTRKETHCEPHLKFPAISFCCTWGATRGGSICKFSRHVLSWFRMRDGARCQTHALGIILAMSSLCHSVYHFILSFSVILSLYSSLYHFHSTIHFNFHFNFFIPLFNFSCHSRNNYHSFIPVSLSCHSLYYTFSLSFLELFSLCHFFITLAFSLSVSLSLWHSLITFTLSFPESFLLCNSLYPLSLCQSHLHFYSVSPFIAFTV